MNVNKSKQKSMQKMVKFFRTKLIFAIKDLNLEKYQLKVFTI